MPEKPTSGDAEQRERQTRVSREQSGLPPEPPDDVEPAAEQQRAGERRATPD